MGNALAGRRIVVPETRELDVLARMLEQHGAITIRCPMVTITDVADAAPVVAWLRRFTTDPPDDLILMTGEGVGRLLEKIISARGRSASIGFSAHPTSKFP
jgi:uroporphyrinogen-III synthase